MEAILKILVSISEEKEINESVALLEAIKKDHPDLFQQAEMFVNIRKDNKVNTSLAGRYSH